MTYDKRNTVIALLALLGIFGVGAILSIWWTVGNTSFLAGGRVAVVPLRGVITDEAAFTKALDGFREDPGVRAFVIEIESPGGTVGASQSIFEAIRDLRDDDDRPVLAWMGDVGASGGYYAAVAADSVYALPGTMTGSIGVIMEFPNAEELFRKVGVDWEVVASAEHKDLGGYARALSSEDRVILEELVSDVHEQFVEVVSDNRNLDRETVRGLADGRVFTGRQANELGLVDGLMTLPETIELAGRMAGLGTDPTVVRPREPTVGLFDLIGGLSLGDARAWIGSLAPLRPSAPRLLFELR
ncbi:MAG: signal peptide peptidase SppA [Gemmatimonadota bacterium]|uniref:signal peptide peptidase SppA n=1 Tax=Candidatus Palauibacter scopulicola TaxID=3056741 RepID=UPI0023A51A51|nr:signal peptide peptidase SppA [Candidatus Palauibacter scopulicola]MDE2662940.1 signal peptide peptidase SppA [Candidatus Palauibacter scopulicola]